MGAAADVAGKNGSSQATRGKKKKEEDDGGAKAKSATSCKLPGCARDRQSKKADYCPKHSKLADALLAASSPSTLEAQKSSRSRHPTLKPQLKARAAVYSAYWPPEDERRKTDPAWYPGVVSSLRLSKVPADKKYGYVRYYNIKFDDGDVLDNVPDHFVMDAEVSRVFAVWS